MALAPVRLGLAWGPEGHRAVMILTERYLRPATRARVQELLGAETPEDASLWADQIAHSTRPETAPWHYIDIPLQDSTIVLARDCPNGQCVLVKTQEFSTVLGDRQASRDAREEALKFVIHFIADLHQPLHCEDHNDRGGNLQPVVFDGHPDNLHWVWDTGLVEAINRDPQELAAKLGRGITDSERVRWQAGTLEAWTLESHSVAQAVAYRRAWAFGPPVLGIDYDARAASAIKVQLEKAAVRLAYVLNQQLQ